MHWLIIALLGIFGIDRWFAKRAVHRREGDDWGTERGLEWGIVHPYSDRANAPSITYAFVKLPSWDWRSHYWNDEFAWHQRVLWWDSFRGLHVQYWSCS